MDSFRFTFWFLAAFDSGRCLAAKVLRIIEPGGGQVALKESAQVIAARVEPQLHGAPIDGNFHFRGTAERQGSVGTAGDFLGRHLAEFLSFFADMGNRAEGNMINVAVGVLDNEHRDPDQHLPGAGDWQREAVKSRYYERIKSLVAHPLF
jgi:hypothetical protein